MLRRAAPQRYPLVLWVDGNHEAYLHGCDISGSVRQAAGASPQPRPLPRQRRGSAAALARSTLRACSSPLIS